jgi:hypothetical protein
MLKRHARRLQMPLIVLGIALITTATALSLGPVPAFTGVVAILSGLAMGFVRSETLYADDAVTIASPVSGRWLAVNSPADNVPSHGTRGYGQAYAIDLVYQPDPTVTWQGVHRWPPARRPETFPAFGQPILAPADGVVVAASGWQRDHWSRNSPLGLVYLIVEGLLREVLGLFTGHFVLGNHVVLDLGDGTYAALAHLKRGSLLVRPGQRVRAGEQLAECGNSGNSSEPHLHFQLMDRARPVIAAGIPFRIDAFEVDGQRQSGVPGKDHAFVATSVS